MEAVTALPAWAEWQSEALDEPWVMPANELD
jgi:hypothetical protein